MTSPYDLTITTVLAVIGLLHSPRQTLTLLSHKLLRCNSNYFSFLTLGSGKDICDAADTVEIPRGGAVNPPADVVRVVGVVVGAVVVAVDTEVRGPLYMYAVVTEATK